MTTRRGKFIDNILKSEVGTDGFTDGFTDGSATNVGKDSHHYLYVLQFRNSNMSIIGSAKNKKALRKRLESYMTHCVETPTKVDIVGTGEHRVESHILSVLREEGGDKFAVSREKSTAKTERVILSPESIAQMVKIAGTVGTVGLPGVKGGIKKMCRKKLELK